MISSILGCCCCHPTTISMIHTFPSRPFCDYGHPDDRFVVARVHGFPYREPIHHPYSKGFVSSPEGLKCCGGIFRTPFL
jgi:hypothetical protein